jgi:hypothetical protein
VSAGCPEMGSRCLSVPSSSSSWRYRLTSECISLPNSQDQPTRCAGIIARKRVGEFGHILAVYLGQARMKPRRGAKRRGQFRLQVHATPFKRLQPPICRDRRCAVHQRIDEALDLRRHSFKLDLVAGDPAPTSACSRFHSAVNSETNTMKRAGSIRRLRSLSSTVASSTSLLMPILLVHTNAPLLRAVSSRSALSWS